MKRAKPTGLCHYCGFRPATQMHEEFSQSVANKAKYGNLIYHELNCKPACEHCNPSHRNVVTRNEYEFVVMMVDNRVLDFIPYKMDRKALNYVRVKEAAGVLRIDGGRIIYNTHIKEEHRYERNSKNDIARTGDGTSRHGGRLR